MEPSIGHGITQVAFCGPRKELCNDYYDICHCLEADGNTLGQNKFYSLRLCHLFYAFMFTSHLTLDVCRLLSASQLNRPNKPTRMKLSIWHKFQTANGLKNWPKSEASSANQLNEVSFVVNHHHQHHYHHQCCQHSNSYSHVGVLIWRCVHNGKSINKFYHMQINLQNNFHVSYLCLFPALHLSPSPSFDSLFVYRRIDNGPGQRLDSCHVFRVH